MEQSEIDMIFRPVHAAIDGLEHDFKQISLPIRREELYQLLQLAEYAHSWRQARAALVTAFVEKQDGEAMQQLMTRLHRQELYLTEAIEELDNVRERRKDA